MASAASLGTAQQLERIAERIHGLVFDFAEPSRSTARAERLIAEVEQVADDLRAVVRGHS